MVNELVQKSELESFIMDIGGERNMDWAKYEEKNLNIIDAFATLRFCRSHRSMEQEGER